MKLNSIGISLILAVLVVSGCASDADTSRGGSDRSYDRTSDRTSGQSLYDRLGGKGAITAVVDDFVARVAADNRINSRFANTNIPRFKKNLVDQICQASGGPCTYTGKDMRTAHTGMRITNEQFDALVGDLVATLDKFKVGEREKNELLSVLGPMRSDIVTAS